MEKNKVTHRLLGPESPIKSPIVSQKLTLHKNHGGCRNSTGIVGLCMGPFGSWEACRTFTWPLPVRRPSNVYQNLRSWNALSRRHTPNMIFCHNLQLKVTLALASIDLFFFCGCQEVSGENKGEGNGQRIKPGGELSVCCCPFWIWQMMWRHRTKLL